MGTAAWAERRLAASEMGSTLVVFDSCREVDALLASGYRQTDVMTVLASQERTGEGRGKGVMPARSVKEWAEAYLRSFYGNAALSEVVKPIVRSLMKTRSVSLLESRAGGKVGGVLALFRTPGILGVYCVGTVPESRRQGVATSLLAKAGEVAGAEGRTLILQTLTSDGALEFYLRRGFRLMHTKRFLERKLK